MEFAYLCQTLPKTNCRHCGLDWTAQRAFEHHFTSSHYKRRPNVNMKAIQELYQKYKDKDDDLILAEGVGQFCEDLEVEPEDIVMVRHQCLPMPRIPRPTWSRRLHTRSITHQTYIVRPSVTLQCYHC